MKIEFCPRCGTQRPDALRWCRKCGLDFEKAERGQFPSDMSATVARRAPPGGWAVDQVSPPEPVWQQPQPQGSSQQAGQPRLDIRPVNDRHNMARLTASALDVRCGGTAGGCLGMFLGAVLGAMLGTASGSPVGALLMMMLGALVGLFVGMRLALALLAR